MRKTPVLKSCSSRSPSTEAVDGGPVELYDLALGERIPDDILDALQDETVVKSSFNAQFERICLSRHLRDLGRLEGYLSPRGWHCDMVWAGYMGFPMSLKKAGAALGLKEQKMTEGKELIRYFCMPCKSTKTNGGRTRNYPHDAPEKWEMFKNYNIRDVEVEMAIADKLKAHPVPEHVWEEYWLSEEINDRGIKVDMQLVEQAIRLDATAQEHLIHEIQRLTGIENPKSVVQMQSWLRLQGVELETLSKKELPKVINSIPEPAKTVLNLRQQLAMSAVKKYTAMKNAVCEDGRLRGMFRFYGANRTGRFCLAEGSMVLVQTRDGDVLEKPIETVSLEDMVYDGMQWVHHDGVVYSGDKDVITWDGVTATPDHEVYIDEWTKVTLEEARKEKLKLWTV